MSELPPEVKAQQGAALNKYYAEKNKNNGEKKPEEQCDTHDHVDTSKQKGEAFHGFRTE